MQDRPEKLSGCTYQEKCGCGALYVTCNDDADGKLFEVLITLGKAGGCGSANKESIGKLISVALRSGTEPKNITKMLGGVSCHKTNEALGIASCITVIAKSINEHEAAKKAVL